MVNPLLVEDRNLEMDRNAYNLAFHDLGFRWHWDSDTYDYLQRQSPDPAEQIRHYLQTSQPHLLTAYGVAFLVHVIRKRQALHRQRQVACGETASAQFDRSQSIGGEIGA